MTGSLRELPIELILMIFDYEIKGDNEAVLLARTSKKWREIILHRKGCFRLTFSGFVSTLPLFLWMRKNTWPSYRSRCFTTAIKGGCLEVVQRMAAEEEFYRHYSYITIATQHGHVDIAKWLVSTGTHYDRYLCVQTAAQTGQIEILKWLKQNYPKELNDWTYAVAARNGRLDVLQWLIDENILWDDFTFASLRDYTPTVAEWLRHRGCREIRVEELW